MFYEDNWAVYTDPGDYLEEDGKVRGFTVCPICQKPIPVEVDLGDSIRVNGKTLYCVISPLELTSNGHDQKNAVVCPNCHKYINLLENNDGTEETDEEPHVVP